ncbi:DDE-type integrase/transposase/recombinase [Staphylococcus pseudintermedius]|nr:DDE-type integrase/transposase/recombinase [Staphylococcus pseudintermedius]EJG5118520.1 DDE-type integrase/transposase/recombinase [Staphylococcus pseudintermedius]
MTKALVISALNKAYTIQEPREGLIHHSDRGSQYASIEYQNLLREEGIQSSMSRIENCYDKACIALWRISLLFTILKACIQR